MNIDERGPDPRPEKRALAEALRMAELPARKPTEADRPPPSTFPKTRAAREALRMAREKLKPKKHKVVGRGSRRERSA